MHGSALVVVVVVAVAVEAGGRVDPEVRDGTVTADDGAVAVEGGGPVGREVEEEEAGG